MATDSALRSVTNTLSTTVADTITLNQLWPAVEVTNQDAAEWLYVRMDGVTAVAQADNATAIPPNSSKVIKAEPAVGTNTIVLSVVGSGNIYTIEGVK